MNNTARIAALEVTTKATAADVKDLRAAVNRLLEIAEGKAAKAPTTEAPATEAPTGAPFRVLREALRGHKATGAIPAGVTVKDAIAQGLMTAEGDLPGGAPKTPVVEVEKAAAKAPKAKAAKAPKKVAAQVDADAPAKEAAAQGPRNAKGHITPKAEWATREALAETGKFDRYEIDALVATGLVVKADA